MQALVTIPTFLDAASEKAQQNYSPTTGVFCRNKVLYVHHHHLPFKIGGTGKTYNPTATLNVNNKTDCLLQKFMMVTEAEASQALGSPDRIINWARQAGRIAMRDFKKVDPRLKPDQTIVTQADLEIERFLAERILTVYPGHNLIGEEGNWNRLTSSPFTWVIDPIDGTTVFSQGLPGWGVSIGLLVNGQPYFGLFYMPLLNDLVYAIRQRGVFCDADDLTHAVRRKRRSKDFVAVSAGTHRNYRLASYNTRALGSIGASLMYTSRGVALGAFIPKARLWDLASGAVILAEAGGDLRYLSGQSIDYTQLVDGRLAPEPLLAGHPDILPDLQRAIAEI